MPGWAWQMVSVAEGLEIGLKSVLGRSWPRAGPMVALCCCFAQPEERRVGSSPAQPQEMLLKILHKGAGEGERPPPQPGSLLAAVIKERKNCSAEKPVI